MFVTNCAPILHRHWYCLQMERSEIPHDPRVLGVPSGASKTISKPMVCSMQTMHYLASTLALSPNGPSFHLSLGLPSSVPKTISMLMVCLRQTVHLSCIYTNTVSKQKEERDSTWPTSPRGFVGVSKMIFKPMVCSTQMVHVSCIKISTIFKRTELLLEPRHLGVPSVLSKAVSKPMAHLA
jgi:hypothetical protein